MSNSDWTRLGGISRDTYVATGANVENYVAAQMGATYKAKGSIAFASLPSPEAACEGFVYNVTDAFTITSAFVEYDSNNAKSYPAGTNVVCVNTSGTTYKWDVLTGMTDLSGYVPTTRKVNGKALSADVSLTGSDIALNESSGAGTVASAISSAAGAASAAGTEAGKNTSARKTTLKGLLDTMYSPTTYPDKQSLYAALRDMDDLADATADLILALRGFCSAS